MWEPKTKQLVERDFLPEILQLLRQYIKDFDYKGNQRVFSRGIKVINADLKQAGKKAEIPFNLTSHVAIKHTFVSLARAVLKDLRAR